MELFFVVYVTISARDSDPGPHTQPDFSAKNVRVQTLSCLPSVHAIRKIYKEIAFWDQALSNSSTFPNSPTFIDKIF